MPIKRKAKFRVGQRVYYDGRQVIQAITPDGRIILQNFLLSVNPEQCRPVRGEKGK